MNTTKFYATLALTVLVGAAACDSSEEVDDSEATDAAEQTETVMPQQEMDPEMMEHVMEIQQIQGRLEPIQQEALQDEELATRLEALQTRFESAMREENSDVVDRMERLQADMAAAQAAGDQERMQSLMMEAQGLQAEMQAVQAAVLERPEIREPVEEFEQAHRARMIEIDPEAKALLDRLDELMAEMSQ